VAGGEHRLDVVSRRATLATALLVVTLVAGCGENGVDEGVRFVQLPESRLIKVQSVGLAAFGRINPHTATASLTTEAFGEPTSVTGRDESCLRTWSDLGLTVAFAADDRNPCAEEARIERLVVSGRAAAEAGWRTAEGIRPLQPAAAVGRIYPEAGPPRSGRHVLVKAPRGSPNDPPVLVVRIVDGRVDTMAFPIDAISN
jgi:hypothetical protein